MEFLVVEQRFCQLWNVVSADTITICFVIKLVQTTKYFNESIFQRFRQFWIVFNHMVLLGKTSILRKKNRTNSKDVNIPIRNENVVHAMLRAMKQNAPHSWIITLKFEKHKILFHFNFFWTSIPYILNFEPILPGSLGALVVHLI